MSGNQRELEVSRHYADDGIWFAVKENRAPQHVRVAVKAALPQRIAEHDNRLLRIVLLLSKSAAEKRRNAQRGKNAGTESRGVDVFGISDSRKLKTGLFVAAKVFKAAGSAGIGEDIRTGNFAVIIVIWLIHMKLSEDT